MECPYDSIKTQYDIWCDFETKNLETHTQYISKINCENERINNLQLLNNPLNTEKILNFMYSKNIYENYNKIYYTNELNKKMYKYYIDY